MRILHVYKDSFPPLHGGIEQHIAGLARRQAAAGHTVGVLVAGAHGRSERAVLDGVTIVRLPEVGRFASSPVTTAYVRALRGVDADIVHFHHPNPIAEASWLAVGDGRPYVVGYHADITRQRVLKHVYGPLRGRFLGGARRIVVASEVVARTSPVLRGLQDRLTVIPYGVPAPPEPLQTPPRAAGTFLFVGRLRAYKGLPILLEAIARTPGARLRVIGEGPLLDELLVQAGTPELTGRVLFLGHVDDVRLDAEIRAARALVLPSVSRAEAFGLVLAEALVRGTPCISTEVGTATSWVNRDGETGLVVPPADPEALSLAMARMTADDELWSRLASGARARGALFSEDAMVASVERVYAAALAPRTAPVPRPAPVG